MTFLTIITQPSSINNSICVCESLSDYFLSFCLGCIPLLVGLCYAFLA